MLLTQCKLSLCIMSYKFLHKADSTLSDYAIPCMVSDVMKFWPCKLFSYQRTDFQQHFVCFELLGSAS